MSSTTRSAPAARRLGDEGGALGAHERMDDRLQTLQCRCIMNNQRREPRPVDLAVSQRAWEGGFDQRRGGAAIERMNGGIGIMHWDAGLAEHGRGRRFAHADRAGEAEHEHQLLLTISAAISARSSAVTCGTFPNQRAKPGTA